MGRAAEDAPPPAAAETPKAEPETEENDDVVSLAAYNVKADRIEDFGFRVGSGTYHETSKPNLVTFWFMKFAPVIASIVPNTAADKAGLQPGERILKSEGRATVGGPFSTGKFGNWYKTEKRKWAEVASGKKGVTWTLEVESPATGAVRTVRMIVPTPAPRWGASTWHAPQGRKPAVVTEPGPLAECSRSVLDNGVWTLASSRIQRENGDDLTAAIRPTAYEWTIGNRRTGQHKIQVTQYHGRTEILLEAIGPGAGFRQYLTSPAGALIKAWRPQKGKDEMTAEAARLGFENELDFWTNHVGKVSPRWPLEVKPGYDPNAIFAVLAAKDGKAGAPVPRPFSDEFLKLPSATTAQQALFADAYGKLGAEPDRWAYTESTRAVVDKRVLVTRVDPSKPEATRCVLLTINGKQPTADEVQRWRDDGGDIPKTLGDIPPLASIVDLKDLRVAQEETAAVVFELPIRSTSAEFPAEKFQALFRVNKAYRSFEDITVRMRDSFRVAGVVKITEAGLHAEFKTLDPAYPPQPALLKGGGAARVLLVKIARDFETTRTDFKRVEPYVEPEPSAAPVAGPGT